MSTKKRKVVRLNLFAEADKFGLAAVFVANFDPLARGHAIISSNGWKVTLDLEKVFKTRRGRNPAKTPKK